MHHIYSELWFHIRPCLDTSCRCAAKTGCSACGRVLRQNHPIEAAKRALLQELVNSCHDLEFPSLQMVFTMSLQALST